MANRVVLGKMLTLLLIGALLSVFGAQSVKAEPVERKVGVKIGDWAKYAVNVTSYSDDPPDPESASKSGYNDMLAMEFWTMTVQNVSGTIITTQDLFHFKNETEKEVTNTVDVNSTGGAHTIISADLDAGDTLFPGNPQYINETIYREYLGELREINHINITLTEFPGFKSWYSSDQWYIDRPTGVPAEWAAFGEGVTTEGYVTNTSISIKICDTNLWGTNNMPEFNIIAYVFSFALITATISIVYLRQRKKQQI